jgi:hypothetical protein
MDEAAVDRLLVDLHIQAQERQPERIVLDLDATDDPVGMFCPPGYSAYGSNPERCGKCASRL